MRKPVLFLLPLGVLVAVPLTCVLGLVGMRYAFERAEHNRWSEQLASFDPSKDDTIYGPHPEYLDELLDNHRVAEKVKTLHFSDSLGDVNVDWRPLNQLPALRELSLYSTFVGTDAFLQAFEGNDKIERVSIESAYVSEAGIASLAKYPNLKDILLRRSGSLSLEPLRGHPALTSITIEYLPITDYNLAVFATIPNLQSVTWHGEHYSEPVREQFESVEGFSCRIVGEFTDGFRATLVREDASMPED